jgi:hypothetical protein
LALCFSYCLNVERISFDTFVTSSIFYKVRTEAIEEKGGKHIRLPARKLDFSARRAGLADLRRPLHSPSLVLHTSHIINPDETSYSVHCIK